MEFANLPEGAAFVTEDFFNIILQAHNGNKDAALETCKKSAYIKCKNLHGNAFDRPTRTPEFIAEETVVISVD